MYSPEELVKFTQNQFTFSTNNLVMKIFLLFFTALILMVSCQKKPVKKHLMFRLQLPEK
jgi:hypothetical protein